MSNATYDAILRAIRPTWISKGDVERILAESAPDPLERTEDHTGD